MDYDPQHKVEEQSIACSVNANYLLQGWLVMYGIMMRQAENGEARKAEVIKAAKRVLEDLEAS